MGQKHGYRIDVNTDTQRAIGADIEAEQALVAANRLPLYSMEAEVKAAIDRVWGS